MSRLRIVHETAYSYRTAVEFGPHRLVLRPREGHDLRVEEMRLEITPAHELEWSRDLFGNSVATAHFLQPSEELQIRSEVVVHQTAPFPSPVRRRPGGVAFPVAFSVEEAPAAAAYQATTFPEDVARVREWVDAMLDLRSIGSAEEVVAAITRAIRDAIKYRRRETKGVQSPTETLRERSGSCRDMATLMLEALRAVGLPARFASGYLDCAASEAGRASTHAWAEAYLPEVGWIGYDPTLGEATAAHHVVTGVSNHPRGVMPVSGSFFDVGNAYLGMKIAVQTERLMDGAEAPDEVERRRCP